MTMPNPMPGADPGPVPIHLALIFREKKKEEELSGILRTAIAEIETFYNFGQERIQLKRYSLSESPVGTAAGWSFLPWTASAWRSLFGKGTEPEAAWTNVSPAQNPQIWEESRGQYKGTIDAEKLLKMIAGMISISPQERLIAVVDQKIVPPQDLVYVIGNSYGFEDRQAAISLVPLDPSYWNIRDAERLCTIKQRFRSVCIAYIGDLLGLDLCEDPACFLYGHVDNPESLDGMVCMGKDHKMGEIEGKGFEPPVRDPVAMQPVVTNPKPKGWQQFA